MTQTQQFPPPPYDPEQQYGSETSEPVAPPPPVSLLPPPPPTSFVPGAPPPPPPPIAPTQTAGPEPIAAPGGWAPPPPQPPFADLATPAAAPVNGATQATMRTTDVSAWFGSQKVLERVSLVMEAGKVTALIGPSGCGKSTYLRILNRMHELVPSAALSGKVELDGVDIYGPTLKVTQTRLRIGMVFQKPNPFPSMTIAQNVLSGLKLSGVKVPNRDALVKECLERAGLWRETRNRLNDGGASLSGGQQQRLCIARALAVRPRVLLMDEPCSALDPISTGVIEETIKELCHEVTIIIVTHNMQQAQRVSDKCALFLLDGEGKPGHIVESGATEQVFQDPVDPRTADYVHGRFG
jgi:phosphate transport system ATP-binding protein